MRTDAGRRTAAALLAAAAAMAAPAAAGAAPTDFDPAFGSSGTARFADGANVTSVAGIARQSSGDVVVLGVLRPSTGAVLERLTPAGQPDATFGAGGALGPPPGAPATYTPQAVTVTPGTDAITTAGTYADGSGNTDVVFARYSAAGEGPTTAVATFASSPTIVIHAMAVQPNGGVVAVGDVNPGSSGQAVVFRLTPSGALDTAFGDVVPGTAVHRGYTRYQSPATDEPSPSLDAVTIQSTNRIIVGGSQPEGMVFALDGATGAPDTTFGGGQGYVLLNFGATGGTTEAIGGLATGGGDAIVVAGTTLGPPGLLSSTTTAIDFARLTAAGAADPTFGGGGVTALRPPAGAVDTVVGAAIDRDGNVVAAGTSRPTAGGQAQQQLLARVGPGGAADAAFGTGGVEVGTLPDAISSFAVQPDGRYLIGGFGTGSSPGPGYVSRLEGASPVATPPASNPSSGAGPSPTGPLSGAYVRFFRRVRVLSGGRVLVPITCPATAVGSCTGRVTLTALVPVPRARPHRARHPRRAGHRRRRPAPVRRRRVTLGSARFSVPAGATRDVIIRLTRGAQRLLAANRRLACTLTVVSRIVTLGYASRYVTTRTPVTLTAPRPPRRPARARRPRRPVRHR